jgi:hypothetical protein
MDSSKTLWVSKTFWANVLTVVAMLLGVPEQLGVDPKYAVTALAVVNVVLRWLTGQPVTLTPQKKG